MRNREIKFRALIDGEMYYQDSNTASAMNGLELFAAKVGSAKGHTPPVMQATGLKDFAGVEVYEGDLMKVIYSDCPSGFTRLGGGREFIEVIGIVKFHEGEWILEHREPEHNRIRRGRLFYMLKDYNRKILGNIYQHPNLLNNQPK